MPTGVYKRVKENKGMFKKGIVPWNTGKKLPEETRRKISFALMGRKLSEETRKKMSNTKKKNPTRYWLGKKLSDEHRRRLGESRIGKKRSEESRKKMSLARMGIKLSPETKKKMSQSRMGLNTWSRGRKASEETKKKMSLVNRGKFLGKHHSEETKKKMSLARLGKYRGNKSPLWRGGITSINMRIRKSLEYNLWRKSIFERDNYTCQKCQQHGGSFVAHHIKNFAEQEDLRLAIDNGCTLCKECHRIFHNKCGRKNNTKEQLNEFLYEKGNS